jgi:hypothetical protein
LAPERPWSMLGSRFEPSLQQTQRSLLEQCIMALKSEAGAGAQGWWITYGGSTWCGGVPGIYFCFNHPYLLGMHGVVKEVWSVLNTIAQLTRVQSP